MNADTFMENFGHLADAPGGVKKLREMVLGLAVRGKLVPQDPEDEPASELLERLIKTDQRVSSKLPRVTGHSVPCKLPDNWVWTRFGRIFDIQGGTQPPKSKFVGSPREGYVRLFQIRDFGKKPVPTYIPRDSVRRFCHSGDVLVGRYGASVGKVFMGREGAYNVALAKVVFNHEFLFNRFVYYLLTSSYLQNPLREMSRSAQAGFNKGDLFPLRLPLPPLAEQHRIVAKVDELMSLCDELETRQRTRRAVHVQLNKAALGRLTAAGTPAEFKTAWSRIRGNFDSLYSVPQTMGELRQTILQLAISGHLVESDLDDGSAVKLLKKVRDKRGQLASAGGISASQKKISPKVGHHPYRIPEHWELCQLGEIAEVLMGNSPPGHSYNESGIGTPLINGPVEFSSGPFGLTQRTKFTTAPTKFCEKGDLLVCVRGSTTGRTNIAAFQACIGRGVAAIRAYIDQSFVNVFVLANRRRIYMLGTGSTFPSVSFKQIWGFPVPVPPLDEQRRIVTKVDELMALCDELETQLTQQQADADKLTEAMVTAILTGDVSPAASRESSVVVPRRDYRDVAEIVSCYAVNRLHDRKSFHRTKHAKVLAMAQGHLGIDLGIAFERQEFGPFHSCIYDLERDAARGRWYATKEGKKNVAHYKPGRTMKEQVRRASDFLGDKLTELDRMLDLFAPLSTRQAELFATTFFAWNDLLIDGQRATKTRIAESFYAWHESKRKFSREKIAEAIVWLRENGMVPTGKGRKTMIPRHETKEERTGAT